MLWGGNSRGSVSFPPSTSSSAVLLHKQACANLAISQSQSDTQRALTCQDLVARRCVTQQRTTYASVQHRAAQAEKSRRHWRGFLGAMASTDDCPPPRWTWTCTCVTAPRTSAGRCMCTCSTSAEAPPCCSNPAPTLPAAKTPCLETPPAASSALAPRAVVPSPTDPREEPSCELGAEPKTADISSLNSSTASRDEGIGVAAAENSRPAAPSGGL